MSDEALLTEIRERFEYAEEQWHEIRLEGETDMRYVAGDPWDPDDRKQREDAGRPCLALDELGQYFNQVINDVRTNPRGIKFAPVGDGANDETARFYADKSREIEYRSRASIVYTTAFENAVQRGYGFCRINTRYESDRSVNQDIWLEPIANPESVLPDPDAVSPTSSDQEYCFVVESRSTSEFPREFPHAKIQSFSTDLAVKAPRWIRGERILVGEYWKVKTKTRKLLLLQLPNVPEPVGVFEDELKVRPDGATVLRTRSVDTKSVCQYLTNGVEILKTTEWAGAYIPIVSCYGKVLYVPSGGTVKRVLLSMTRLARDPYMAYCFYRTSEIEVVGMTTKNPYWAYEGTLTPLMMKEVAKSIHEPVAVLLAKPLSEATGQQILPLPVRNYSEVQLQGLSTGAEEMRRAIQAAMGSSPLPTQAQRHNEKSGIALKEMNATAQRGAFHFVDHYNDMIQHVGVIFEDLMDKIYDTPREVGIRKPNDEAQTVRINDPVSQATPKPLSAKGKHQVTVSTGPSFDSEREVASEFADTLVQSKIVAEVAGPQAAAKLLARAVKLKNLGPIGDEIADLLDPPQPKEGEEPTPEQMKQMLEHAKQQIQQLGQAAQQMQHDLETDQAKQQAALQMKQLEIQSRERVADQDRAAKIEIARISAAKQTADLAAEAEEERIALGIKIDSEAQQADLTRAHEAALAEQAHAHQQALAEQANAHATALANRPARKTITTKTLNRTPDGVVTGANEQSEEVTA